MKILLDTNVLLRLLDESSDKRVESIRKFLSHPEFDVYVSVASLWEIAIKWRLKKLTLTQPPDFLPPMISAIGMGLLPIGAAHVLEEVAPEPKTRDPFDRLLLAQCKVESMRLVTVDRELQIHPLAYKSVE